ncbi:DNA alkylation repair enzyme [compost metagenome]
MAKAVKHSFDEVYAQLEAWGSEKVRAINARQGAGDNQFGVKMGDLRALAKAIKVDHALAMRLWETGNADARILATMIMDPAALTEAELEAMLTSLTYFNLADKLVDNVIARSPHAEALRLRWMPSSEELIGRSGWGLLVEQIVARKTDDLDIEAILAVIEAEILDSPVRKQERMTYAQVEIALRLPEYRDACIALGERLGRFDQRPIPKGCTPFYAPDWIAAVLARKK